MFSLLPTVLAYLLLPVGAVILGGFIATFRTPGPRAQSVVQHVAAGVVFAAVAAELLPKELNEHMPLPLIVGFGGGVAFMLGVEWLVKRLGRKRTGEEGAKGENEGSRVAGGTPAVSAAEAAVEGVASTTLLIVIAVDLAIDGLIIGVGFAAGAKQGLLITIALTLEVLFVGVSVAAEFAAAGASRGLTIGITAGLGAVLAAGAVLGVTLLGALSGTGLAIVLAFGSAALLYLVTEELLVQAHVVPDTPFTAATFFFGFLALLVIDMLA